VAESGAEGVNGGRYEMSDKTRRCAFALPRRRVLFNPSVPQPLAESARRGTGRGLARILVTGAAGFVGRSVCPELARRGHAVLGIVRTDAGAPAGIRTRAVGDIAPTTDWSGPLREIDVVIHLAARAHRSGSDADFALEPPAAAALARAAARAGVRRLVHLSSIKAVADATPRDLPIAPDAAPHPADAYGRAKLATEQALRNVAAIAGLDLVVVRPPLVYGPGVRANFGALIRLAASGLPLPFAKVDNRRSLIFIGNLVDLICRAAEHPAAAGATVHARDDEEFSTPGLIRVLAAAQGREARLFSAPDSTLAALGTLPWLGPRLARLIQSLRIDDSDTRAALGWSPPVAAAEGLAAAVKGLAE